jgi:hypothetical protein
VRDGLAASRVNAVAQGAAGELWFGTLGGLRRYDGTSWNFYTTDDGLPGNLVNALCRDGKGTLWAGTTKGAAWFDGSSWSKLRTPGGFAGNEIRCIAEDRNGNVWLGTVGGAYRFDGNAWEAHRGRLNPALWVIFVLGIVVIPLYLLLSLFYTLIRKVPRDTYLVLGLRTLLVLPAFAIAVVLHNLNYGLFIDSFRRTGGDEALFFTVALLLLPLFLIVSIGYTLVTRAILPLWAKARARMG